MATPTEMAREAQEGLAILRNDHSHLTKRIDDLELMKLTERVSILETKIADLSRYKEDTEKRHWQFVYIFLGAMASLAVTVIVQLVLAIIKK